MNYQKIYDSLVGTRKMRILDGSVYVENHHIIPKSLGGSNSIDNLVALTAREHFIAHLLLWKIHKNRPMGYALSAMMAKSKYHDRVFSSRHYEIARKANSIARTGDKHTDATKLKIGMAHSGKIISEEQKESLRILRLGSKSSEATKKAISSNAKTNPNFGMKGKKHSEETRRRMSELTTGKYKGELSPLYGKQKTIEQKNKISESLSEYFKDNDSPFKGKKHSEASRKLLSEKALNRQKLICPHCGVSASPSMAKRWHFDNCKKINTKVLK